MSTKKINKEYWDTLYKSNEIGWDIGYASPALSNYIDQLENKDLKILIPGCGNSYEAQYLLEKGFKNITVIDISPTLTVALEQKFEPFLSTQLKVITGDFFKLKGEFDLILEQTFLSALEPALRNAYIKKLYDLLKSGGRVAGVIFGKVFEEDGPPFGGTNEEYHELFNKYFDVKTLEPCYNSIERRSGSELFIILCKDHHLKNQTTENCESN